MELTPEQKELVEGLNKKIDTLNTELKAAKEVAEETKESVALVTTLKEELDANVKELESLKGTAKAQGEKINELVNSTTKGAEATLSIKEQIAKSIEDNKEAWEAFKSGRSNTFQVALKAAGTVTTGNITGGTSNVVSTTMLPGYVDILSVSPFVMDYCNLGRTNSSKIEYVEKKNRDGSTVFIAEAAAKTQIDFDWEKNTSDAKKVAPYIKVSDEMLDDVEFMAAAIEGELRYQTLLEASEGVLSGNGTGANLSGITNVAQAYGLTTVLTTTPNLYDAIRAAATQIMANNGRATHVFLNPVDATNMGISKGTTGYYVIIDGMVQMLPYQVIETNQITVGQILVGDMSKSNVRIYKDFDVQYGWENDDFTKNLVTVRGEMRLHHWIADNHTPCFVYDAIADIITAITI